MKTQLEFSQLTVKALEATALEGYREKKLSHAQVGRMLGFDRFETDEFLKAHAVSLNYLVADLENNRRPLEKLWSK